MLAGKTLFISGATRGIGKAIALRAARDGANVVIAAKTVTPHPKLPGTIYTAADEVERAGGRALACEVDIRFEEQVEAAARQAKEKFGSIDILVNNASAISMTNTTDTSMKKYDLMHNINTRGTYVCTKALLPYLKEGNNPHILNNSPPLNMKPVWFKNHVAYTMAKYGMSMCVLGHAEEFRPFGIAVNALWPRTAIYTAAMEMLGGGESIKDSCRTADIMADAAHAILTQDSKACTGNFFVDDEALNKFCGITDFSKYQCVPGAELMPDFFLDDFLKTSPPADEKEGGELGSAVQQIRAHLGPASVQKMNATFRFDIKLKGGATEQWLLDLKNGDGGMSRSNDGDGEFKADVVFGVDEKNFVRLFAGELKATQAFMMGSLKISGSMGKAMKLEQFMKQLHSGKQAQAKL